MARWHHALIAALALSLFANAQTLSETQKAAQLLGVAPEAVTQVDYRVIPFPAIGMTLTVAKAADAATGEVHYACVDQAGNPADLSAVRNQEILARRQNPTMKMQPKLRRAIAEAEATDLIRVMLWLDYDQATLDGFYHQVFATPETQDLGMEKVRELEGQVTALVVDYIKGLNAPVAEALISMGTAVRYVSTTAPVLAITATPAELATIAELPAVETLYLENLEGWDANNEANGTHRTDRVHRLGIQGALARVAIMENNGLDPNHPLLNVTAWFNAGAPNPDDHVHGTAGCIASKSFLRRGSAPGASIYSANAASYSDTNLTAAGDWIAITNIDITNMSWGVDTSINLAYIDRYIDYQSRTYSDSYVASAGDTNLGYVTSPGKAWNALTVGSHTVGGNNNWSDDSMSSTSNTIDPATFCEKPNVAANGQDVDTLGDGTVGGNQTVAWLYDGYSGTSFAAAHCAGNLANALTMDSSLSSPETATALMMATAWHNIEGDSRLSEEDGAGGINGFAAVNATIDNRTYTVVLNSGTFSSGGFYTFNIQLQAGEKTRVCIAWSANANAGYTTTLLDADLDLAVYEGSNQTSGTSLGFSASFNNNFEIVEFYPNISGTHTVRINAHRFDGTSERVGIAWSQKYRDNASFTLHEWTAETLVTAGPTIGNLDYHMDVRNSGSPGDLYICAPGTPNGPGTSYGGGTWTNVNFDLWTTLWLDHLVSNSWFWTGFSGTLGADGETTLHSMAIPDFLGIQGMEVHHWCYTFEAGQGYDDNIKEVSKPHRFEIWPRPSANYEADVGDDSAVEVNLPFSFPFYGNTYTSVFINANGSLTFGSGDADWTETAAQMQSEQPRIACFWDDLHCGQLGAQVRVREVLYNHPSFVVEFINVPERDVDPSENTGRITLKPDGTVRIELRDMTLQDCIVGISPGNGTATGPVDLDQMGNQPRGGSYFEVFTPSNPIDLTHDSQFNWSVLEFTPTSPTTLLYLLKMDILPEGPF